MFRLGYLSLFILIILSSCSPRYKVVYIYQPPQTFEGKKCIEKCEKEKISCQSSCIDKRKECYKEAIKIAKEIYREKLKEYQIEYNNYLRLYRIYQKRLSIWQSRKIEIERNYFYFSQLCSTNKRFCSEKKFYYRLLHELRHKKPVPPEKPEKPNFSEILNEQKRKLCNLNCNCTEEYNICFQSCGGKIKIKKVCIENCD